MIERHIHTKRERRVRRDNEKVKLGPLKYASVEKNDWNASSSPKPVLAKMLCISIPFFSFSVIDVMHKSLFFSVCC